jgi:TRAP-type C4-dicarboxylate transport system substrate-binding protein
MWMNISRFQLVIVLRFFAAMFALGCATSVAAQELPTTKLKVLGGLSTRNMYKEVELPFWTTLIPQRSSGRVSAEIKAFDEMGIKGPELFRLMKQGVIEFCVVPLSYYTSDTPLYEAIDLSGLATDTAQAKLLVKSFSPVLSRSLSANLQLKLLGVSPYSSQVLFCNFPIRGLNDLKGKTIRTASRSQSDLMEALGAKGVTIPFNEVLSELNNKKIACAVSSPPTAYTAKWYTAATHIYALPVGWNQEVHAVNQNVWDQLDASVQVFLSKNIDTLIEQLWSFSDSQSQIGFDCLTGAKSCKLNPRGKMILVRPTQNDLAIVKKMATQKVAAKWANRCSVQCVTDFNSTAGKALKFTVNK